MVNPEGLVMPSEAQIPASGRLMYPIIYSIHGPTRAGAEDLITQIMQNKANLRGRWAGSPDPIVQNKANSQGPK